ncbi:MAG: response regulator [Myxococcales bacterium]|nr:response regulator [Myxococcales bacterium]
MATQTPASPEPLRLKLLLIEDDLTDAALTTRELRKGGFAPEVTRVDHAEALRSALLTPGWDVILSDWSMPGFSGAEALALVQELAPEVPFLFVSGVLGEERAVEAMRAGARDFVVKGNPARLCAAIRRELEETRVRRAQRSAEQALRAEEMRTRLLMDAVPAGIVELDLGGLDAWCQAHFGGDAAALSRRIETDRAVLLDALGQLKLLHTNGEVFRILAVAPNFEALSRGGARFLLPETEAPLTELLAAMCSGVSSHQAALSVVNAAGRRVELLLTYRLATGETSRRGCLSLLDVTTLRQMEERLRVGERLEALGRLASGIAHDVNNLVTVIDSGVSLVELRAGSDPKLHEPLKTIREASQQAAALTRQLLHFSRQGTHRPARVEVNSAIMAIEPLLRRLLGERVGLRLGLEARAALTFIDPSQLSQVLLNLVGNAGDASREGGTVSLDTAVVRLDPNDPRRASFDTEGERFVRITVADAGHGMDDVTRQRAFEPFFTTKPEGRGTGLGLATVYGIVREAHGCVDVESSLGVGTRVDVYLAEVPR